MTDLRIIRPFLKGAAVSLCAACIALAGAARAQAESCAEGHIDLRGDFGQVRYQIELADEPHERERGLMFREEMAQSAGMLFVYEREQRAVFWMRNTYLPLDLIFADGQGVVQHVHENAVPLDETLIPGGDAIQFVLEVNAGQAARLGLKAGAEMRHPSIKNAQWTCDAGQ
ncbi:DUF192 domain-containing protein [Thalassobius sp. Cn5-15]|jgi:uncharacterized membrane protein (UPF0127 family)|uniref:DUF192 domain-containing protein n=1 Tax=Thalassobius sp. Cn5-15 TaxID=2917763 RepID=UPI001EF2A98E|nr:DUF192 domain-containing protein [Thalassobius sp. Cn5-15]MCG7492223.1 DUF192 domain-containing protein [Thalassobius sp. Cn5-15]